MSIYSKSSYWDQRYLKSPDTPHEWYQGYKDLRRLLHPIYFATQSRGATIRPQTKTLVPSNEDLKAFPTRERCRVLILGCGNSTFGQDMLMDGWTGGIVNVDFSQVVIDQMRTKYDANFYHRLPKRKQTAPPPMEFICADMTSRLPFEDDSFDLIVCKGSFDAVLCGAGSVGSIRRVVKECVRLLTPGYGVLFVVTHANPDNRIVFLEHENSLNHYWEGVTAHRAERGIHEQSDADSPRADYVYICRKLMDHKQPLLGKENGSPRNLFDLRNAGPLHTCTSTPA